MTKVSRVTIWEWVEDGDVHDAIECAVRTDGTSPADAFLEELRAGIWEGDPNHAPAADDGQIHDYYALIAKIEYVGRTGKPENRAAVNSLEKGIWEFRHSARRLSYWDTPGDGTFDPKPKIDDIRTLPPGTPTEGYWWYPEMDVMLRLGCAWQKDSQMAPPEMIAEAVAIRQEDCAHDI